MTRSERSELVIRDYEFLRTIGKGSYGEVWLCRQKKDDKQYVVKKIDITKSRPAERNAALLECKLLSELKHPNIVPYKESFEHRGFLYIAMGYCEGGDLYTRIRLQNGRFLSERQLVEWFIQIVIALQHMHSKNILHRDLKTQNIFLTRTNIIKVGDLGIARVLETSNSMATTLIGTPYYMSPELFSNQPYNHKSDIWALGCVLYEMSTLKHAFNARNFNALSYKILSGRKPDMPKQYSPELLDIMRAMLHQKPEKRPSARRVLSNPFIRKHIVLFLESTKDRSVRLDERNNENTRDESDSSSSKLSEASSSSTSSTKTPPEVECPPSDKGPSSVNTNSVCSEKQTHQSSSILECHSTTATEPNGNSTPNTVAVEPASKVSQPVPTINQMITPCSVESSKQRVLLMPSPLTHLSNGPSELSVPTIKENLEDMKAHKSDAKCITVQSHTNWLQLDARQRRRERRRLSEHAVEHQAEPDGSEIIRRIILRQRRQIETNDDVATQVKRSSVDPIPTQLQKRPASHPSCLINQSHTPDSVAYLTPTDSKQSLPFNNSDKHAQCLVAHVSDPLPWSSTNSGPFVSASPDLGYVSITTSPSPSLCDRPDQLSSTPCVHVIDRPPLNNNSSQSVINVSSDSAVGFTDSTCSISSTRNPAFYAWNKQQSPTTPLLNAMRVPLPIREDDKEIEGLATCMAETLRLGDVVNPSISFADPVVTQACRGSIPIRCSSVSKEPAPMSLHMAYPEKTRNTQEQQKQQSMMNNSGTGPTEPYEETISRTARLKQRFTELHNRIDKMSQFAKWKQECLREVGLSKLHRVYQILEGDMPSEKQEPILKDILGADQYAHFMGKIWQLKLFEEHMFQR